MEVRQAFFGQQIERQRDPDRVRNASRPVGQFLDVALPFRGCLTGQRQEIARHPKLTFPHMSRHVPLHERLERRDQFSLGRKVCSAGG